MIPYKCIKHFSHNNKYMNIEYLAFIDIIYKNFKLRIFKHIKIGTYLDYNV